MKNLIFYNIQITTNLYDHCATEVEEETFKPSLTKQLLNILKLWCEWSLNQRSERYNLGDWGGGGESGDLVVSRLKFT